LPLEYLIDGQAAHAYRWHGRVAWQLLAVAGRKISEQQACRRQGVVAGDALSLSQGDKTGGNASANILSDVFP
jgi:hypothetical protein